MEQFTLGTFLKSMREKQGLSTRALVERCKEDEGTRSVTTSQINRIENGKTPNPGFRTLQKIAAALGIPLVIVLDGSHANIDTTTFLSSQEVSQALSQARERPELIELLLYCQELTDEQIQAILGVARSLRGFTRPIEQPEA